MQYKILFISNTAIFSRFNLHFMRWFRQQGWQVDYVSNGEVQIPDCTNQYSIPIQRNPYRLENVIAYCKLKKILLNGYDIIHCHTPMGGILGRLAIKNYCIKTKLLYTAHGFHFYKGAPFMNWLLYYPMEKYFAKYTDILITINEEDYKNAKYKLSSCKSIYKVDGVGVDLSRFRLHTLDERVQLRNKLGYREDDFILTNVAELNKNKNQIMLIKILPILKKTIPSLKILFIGSDNNSGFKRKLELLADKLEVNDVVCFLGYRYDVENLTAISDVAFSASFREGLPVNIIEAMASGIPVVCKKNRGHDSLIENGHTGLLFSNSMEMMDNILKIYNSKKTVDFLSKNALENSKRYDRELIMSKMACIYRRCMPEYMMEDDLCKKP